MALTFPAPPPVRFKKVPHQFVTPVNAGEVVGDIRFFGDVAALLNRIDNGIGVYHYWATVKADVGALTPAVGDAVDYDPAGKTLVASGSGTALGMVVQTAPEVLVALNLK